MGDFQRLWRFLCGALITGGSAVVLALLAPRAAHADTAKALAGTWSASPLAVNWQVGDWGAACGPAPSGGGEPGGSVTITQNGSELTLSGGGRQYSTTQCWELYPGIQRISHSVSAHGFQNVCKTNQGDPRQAKLVTTITTSDTHIAFDETGQYQFVIEGQNCTASVRRTRSYNLISRLGEEPAAKPAPSADAKPAPTSARRASGCENPGLPERLEVRPSRKLMRPGESFEFRSSVVDAHGCPLPLTPTWRVISGAGVLSVGAPGKITANPNAPESQATLEVTLGDRSVRVEVEIASKQRYDALLQAEGLSETGESKDAAVLRVASESMGGHEVVARDASPGRSRWFVGIAGACALLLGILGFVLVRRNRPAPLGPSGETPSQPMAPLPTRAAKACPTCREEFPPEAEFCPNDGNRLVQQTELGRGPGGSVCPVCGRGFNPGTQTCPEHGEELVPAAAYAASGAPALTSTLAIVITRTICPVCGKQYGGETRFCGECGAAVVPIN